MTQSGGMFRSDEIAIFNSVLEGGLSHILPRIDLLGGVGNALERLFVCLLIDLRLCGIFRLLRMLMLSCFSHVLGVSRHHHQHNRD
jgi:hypothetical protein